MIETILMFYYNLCEWSEKQGVYLSLLAVGMGFNVLGWSGIGSFFVIVGLVMIITTTITGE